jgi:hypothetical protein
VCLLQHPKPTSKTKNRRALVGVIFRQKRELLEEALVPGGRLTRRQRARMEQELGALDEASWQELTLPSELDSSWKLKGGCLK